MRLPPVVACGAVSAFWALGCSSSGPSAFATMGMPGIPSPARIGANLVLSEVAVDGQSGPHLLVDTGSPFTLINPTSYPTVTFPDTAQVTVNLTFGAFTVENVPSIQTTFIGDGSFNVPQIVGGNLMRQFAVQLDYSARDPSMAFRLGGDSGMSATGVEQPGGVIPFRLEGGGVGQIDMANTTRVTIPATRIPLTVAVEGVSYPFILDTGASEVTVRSAIFATLTADHRPQLSGLPIGTAMGPTTAEVTRARSITLGEETVVGAPVMTIGDTLLDSLEQEVKHPIDGLLGGSFLREFLVTVDYPQGVLHLQRYAPPAPIVDEFKRVGIEIGAGTGGHRYTVAKVYSGSDAAGKQISLGDEIVSIDGQALDGLDAITADDALDGTVGSTKQIGLGNTTVRALANMTLAVQVDDLLPAPLPSVGPTP